MNSISFSLKSRGLYNFFRRIYTIFKRFSLNPSRYLTKINKLKIVMTLFHCRASLPVSTILGERYNNFIAQLAINNIEILSHSYTHIDHSKATFETQCELIQKSKKILQKENLAITGFRAPYLHWNQDTIKALKENGFLFNSSAVFFWKDLGIDDDQNNAYMKALAFYQPYQTQQNAPRPYYHPNGILEIPISLPDDEILIDRLGIKDDKRLYAIWNEILERSYVKEALFTVQLHPERIDFLKNVLIKLHATINKRSPGIWVASLNDIYDWWIKRPQVQIIHEKIAGKIKIKLENLNRHTILITQSPPLDHLKAWDDNHSVITKPEFMLEDDSLPMIGLANKALTLQKKIRELGYCCEQATSPQNNYSLFLDYPLKDYELEEKINHCPFPLIKIGYWPDHCKSAFCITGDIDSITIQDFICRLFKR